MLLAQGPQNPKATTDPTPALTFPKFPTPAPQHKGNEIWLKINGNHGRQQEISVSTKVSKEILQFQQEIPI